jgi:uncharacterized protein YjiS (DUF1127 family)
MQIPAYIHLPGAAPAASRPSPIGKALAGLAAVLRFWWLARRTEAEFDRLDAATLRDIGMTRVEMQRRMQAEREALLRRLRHFAA